MSQGRGQIPTVTSLCAYCHRVFWFSLFALAMACMAVYIVSFVSYIIFYQGFYLHTEFAFVTAGIIFVGFLYYILCYQFKYKTEIIIQKPGIIGQWFSAKKQRICPLVEFKDD